MLPNAAMIAPATVNGFSLALPVCGNELVALAGRLALAVRVHVEVATNVGLAAALAADFLSGEAIAPASDDEPAPFAPDALVVLPAAPSEAVPVAELVTSSTLRSTSTWFFSCPWFSFCGTLRSTSTWFTSSISSTLCI